MHTHNMPGPPSAPRASNKLSDYTGKRLIRLGQNADALSFHFEDGSRFDVIYNYLLDAEGFHFNTADIPWAR